MKKNLFALLFAICLLFSAACLAEEEVQVDVTLEGYWEAGGMLYVTWTDDAYETGGVGMIGTPGQTIGDVLESNGILSAEPVLEGDVFEGWMEVALTVTVDEDGFEWEEYSLIPDQIYTTEELMTLVVPEYNVMYVAKWASVPAEDYYAPYESETIVLTSITLFSNEGVMLVNSGEDQYENTLVVSTVEPGQTFGEVLELDTIADITAEDAEFTGWTVYDVAVMETSGTFVEEEGVLCYELFEDYYMVLREYTVCYELLSTEELAEVVCDATEHVVIANFQ